MSDLAGQVVAFSLTESHCAVQGYVRQLEGHEDPWWPKLAAELGLDGGGKAPSAPEVGSERG